jgi:hypothetical protein
VNNAKIELTGNNTRNINPKEQCENKTYREQWDRYKSEETDREHYKKYSSQGTRDNAKNTSYKEQ